MMSQKLPVVITTFKSKADLVRQIASKYNFSYIEKSVKDNEDLIKFSFKPLNDAETKILAKEIPTEVFAYKATIDNQSP